MGVRKIIKKGSKGFTMIEMIAAMVLVSILVPGISSILGGTLMNIALTQIAVLSNMEADYAQRNFKKHIDGARTFVNVTDTTLQYTDYSGVTYLYEFNGRVLRYKKDSGDRGKLLENIVGIDADTLGYRSKFVYKDKYYADLDEPIDESKIRGVNLIFYILRGESVYSYSTYAAMDKYQLDIWD
jgi:prepilin-type N-terminal cleavage/methylation domain-containing protein